MDLTGGEGVDAAIEAFGFPKTWESCIRVTKAGGRVSNIGYHGEVADPLHVPLDAVRPRHGRQVDPQRPVPRRQRPDAAALPLTMTGRFDPTPMTTHRFPFDDVERAFEMMRDKEDGIIKPLITF